MRNQIFLTMQQHKLIYSIKQFTHTSHNTRFCSTFTPPSFRVPSDQVDNKKLINDVVVYCLYSSLGCTSPPPLFSMIS